MRRLRDGEEFSYYYCYYNDFNILDAVLIMRNMVANHIQAHPTRWRAYIGFFVFVKLIHIFIEILRSLMNSINPFIFKN